MTRDEDDTTRYQVVVNEEEQYSLWAAHATPPLGWRETGFEGDRDACLARVREVWTDMRPLSLRRVLGGDAS
ncbi:MbtH family NRPS accessory protein [Burkholderia sp. FERM BP-3421]|jgi:MbtH protein|uniref:MbtH family protein n=1 Tax=Burkholderia sp. FERM BP-3421 TaxID=1494466 RepID=UPI00235FDE83|nr:MbtH family NRPS accessory protein [Burkholderia sp. FERM BP-3421]WDD93598.1 MbtH family NRPS accessory protein [Burkholderia sp. FERM BP-3421]